MQSPKWSTIAKEAAQAYRVYKLYCKALGRFSTKATKLKLGVEIAKQGRSRAMKALNHWRKVYLDLMLHEQMLRV